MRMRATLDVHEHNLVNVLYPDLDEESMSMFSDFFSTMCVRMRGINSNFIQSNG